MLVQLAIRDIVLIDRLDLSFADELTVLTGETGAGKSILLDALSLALGARGDGGLVRHGAAQGQVTAVFDPPAGHAVLSLIGENGIDIDSYLILRRVQMADGRSKAFINDQPVSVALMREAGRLLVELHGQHDERALLQASSHRSLLDAFGGLETRVEAVTGLWNKWQALKQGTREFQSRVEASRREEDYLRSAVGELAALAPQPGEEEDLAHRRQRMMKSERIASDLDEAVRLLGGDASPIPMLAGLAKRLERKAQEFPGYAEEAVRHLDQSLDSLQSALQRLETALRQTEFDPAELERSEERLFALRAASRKFSVPVEGLPDLAVRLADDLDSLNLGEEKLKAMQAETEAAGKAYHEAAGTLSGERAQAARQLCERVMRELPALRLDEAEFLVDHQSDRELAGETGIDQIEFWVRTNPGTKSGPLVKVASGGELSRFLLALKVALADKGSAPTLVFDEIDTGLGGAVADAIGKRLFRLSQNVQVLSVTHAPQVAARAASHFVISKTRSEADGVRSAATRVSAISGAERREEIARMLAGAEITDEARAAAERLINQPAA